MYPLPINRHQVRHPTYELQVIDTTGDVVAWDNAYEQCDIERIAEELKQFNCGENYRIIVIDIEIEEPVRSYVIKNGELVEEAV